MASVFNEKTGTYIIDTVWNASTSPLSGFDGPVKIKSIRWVGATTAGHQLVITNFNDTDRIFASVADGANFLDEILIEDGCKDGFKVTTLGSGVVYVDLR